MSDREDREQAEYKADQAKETMEQSLEALGERVNKACAEIDRLRAINADLLAVCKNMIRIHSVQGWVDTRKSMVPVYCECDACKMTRDAIKEAEAAHG